MLLLQELGNAADAAVANVGDNKAATGLSDLEDLDVSSDATLDLTTGTANAVAQVLAVNMLQ